MTFVLIIFVCLIVFEFVLEEEMAVTV